MDATLFAKGAILGASIAAPVGPIGILCIHRTLAAGLPAGLLTGLGAATADALYGSLAAFGITGLTGILVGGQTALQIIGGVFLGYLGVMTLRADTARPEKAGSATVRGLGAAYGSALALTLANPMTILSFAAVFPGLGFVGRTSGGLGAGAWLVGGVFLGSTAWWLVLTLMVGTFKRRISPGLHRWINRLSAAVLLAFAAWILIRSLPGGVGN